MNNKKEIIEKGDYNYFVQKLYKYVLVIIGSFFIGLLIATFIGVEKHYFQNILISWFIALIVWTGNIWIFRKMVTCYPNYQQNTKRILLSFFFITSYTNLVVLLFNVILAYTFYSPSQIFTQSHLGLCFLIVTQVTFMVTIIYESIRFYGKWKATSIEAERLKKENIRAQLEGLKSQISPHFLFNSLNTLASIIPEDPNLSVQFVEKLSQVYRYVLQYGEKDRVSLQEELTFIEAYLFLQQIRFGNSIRFEENLSLEDKQMSLLPLTLQLLVENAIKHNIVTSRKPLTISLAINKEGMLVVKNNLQEKKVYDKSTGLGLKNIQTRYQLITNKAVSIEKKSTEFVVKVPLVS